MPTSFQVKTVNDLKTLHANYMYSYYSFRTSTTNITNHQYIHSDDIKIVQPSSLRSILIVVLLLSTVSAVCHQPVSHSGAVIPNYHYWLLTSVLNTMSARFREGASFKNRLDRWSCVSRLVCRRPCVFL